MFEERELFGRRLCEEFEGVFGGDKGGETFGKGRYCGVVIARARRGTASGNLKSTVSLKNCLW